MDRARNREGNGGKIRLYQSFVPGARCLLRRSGTDDFCIPGTVPCLRQRYTLTA